MTIPKGFTMIYDIQHASMWKRISAFLFDGILLGIAAVLFAWALSSALGFDRHNAALDNAYARIGEAYGVDFNISLSAYDAMTAEQQQALSDAYAALSADPQAVTAYNAVVNLTLLITSLGILFAHAALEYAVPMCFGNGQTLGKKIFGLGVMRQDGVMIDGRILFIRTFLGKYTFETMIPVLILMMIWFGVLGLAGTLVLLGIVLLQGILLIRRDRLTIHDALAATIAVDIGSQMIFPDRASMIAYKEKIHAQNAAKQAY